MINVNGLKRNAKNIVKKYSDAQVKVREATSNDPWGPPSTLMAEIADLTYNVVAFSEIMQMIWKRLNDHGKNWRHVYKALVVLEYLIKTGTEKVAQQCIENIFAIQTLKDFQYMEDNKDYGMNIREKSKKMVALLKDSEKLKAERARAMKAKSRLAESLSSVGKRTLGASAGGPTGILMGSGTSSSDNGSNYSNYHNETSSSTSGSGQMSDSALSSDLDSARPQTAIEEENQLKLALALSKEEAEQQEKTRKNDELRLKLALDVSKKTASGSTPPPPTSSAATSQKTPAPGPSKSTIDDLLGLSIPPPQPLATDTKQPSPFPPQLSQAPTSQLQPFAQLQGQNQLQLQLQLHPEPQNDPWSVDPWQPVAGPPATGNTATLVTPQQPITNFTLPTLSTSNNNININTFATSNTNSFPTTTPASTAIASKRLMSKNPFED